MHIAIFHEEHPLSALQNSLHRIKLFINLDSALRVWRTFYMLPEILARYRHVQLRTLPPDRIAIAAMPAQADLLKGGKASRIAGPTLSAVAANAEAVAHQVLCGKPMIAVEFH